MSEVALETTTFGGTTTLRGFAPRPLGWLWVAAVFLPFLIVGERSHTGDAKHWREYDAFWKGWHAKYDGYKSSDGKHSLNNVSLPSEWPRAVRNAVCRCGFEVRNGATDVEVLDAFTSHLESAQPGAIDLGTCKECGEATLINPHKSTCSCAFRLRVPRLTA